MAGAGWYPQRVGGLEKYQYGLARALTSIGDDVDYFCSGDPVAWDDRSHVFKIANEGQPTLRRLLEMRRRYRTAYRGPYDVVDIHFPFYAIPLLPFIARRTARVVHFQGPWGLESLAEGSSALVASAKAAVERIVFSRVDRFVTLSSAFAAILHETYGIARERIDVIPMGIDCNEFVPSPDRHRVRAELGWSSNVPIVFTARRMVKRVGVVELIAAAKILRDRGIQIQVKIAGKGPLLDELRATVLREGLRGEIELLGFIPDADLVRAYQAADVTLLPTQHLEGFGTIIAESLACGTPVLGTPVGGIVETLGAIDPSLLARSTTPGAIAELVRDFVEGRLHVLDAAGCRRYAEEHFAWPTIAERNRVTFRRAAAERRSR